MNLPVDKIKLFKVRIVLLNKSYLLFVHTCGIDMVEVSKLWQLLTTKTATFTLSLFGVVEAAAGDSI